MWDSEDHCTWCLYQSVKKGHALLSKRQGCVSGPGTSGGGGLGGGKGRRPELQEAGAWVREEIPDRLGGCGRRAFPDHLPGSGGGGWGAPGPSPSHPCVRFCACITRGPGTLHLCLTAALPRPAVQWEGSPGPPQEEVLWSVVKAESGAEADFTFHSPLRVPLFLLYKGGSR